MKHYWQYQYEHPRANNGRLGIEKRKGDRAPSVGSCGHEAVSAFIKEEDWEKAVDNWFEREIALRPLFDEEIEEYREVTRLVKNIIPRYLDKYKDEKFKPVAVEQELMLPLPGASNTYLRVYIDAIMEDNTGHLWLWEHKFPQKVFRDEDSVELDGQIGTYQYAAHKNGYNVIGTVYNQLLARLPSIPKTNKDGSLSRAKIYTDWDTYSKAVLDEGKDPADYLEMQEKLQDFEFFKRYYIYRSLKEVKLFARDMQRRIWDLKKKKNHIYMSESAINCRGCSFKELCLERVQGGDVEYLVTLDYIPKLSREEKAEEGHDGYEEETEWVSV